MANSSLIRVSVAMVVTLVAIMNVARFVGDDSSPLGFDADEASNALHMVCLVQTGADANGVPFPVFAAQYEPEVQQRDHTGLVPPIQLYLGALWEAVFGPSVESIRAISAFMLGLMTAGVYLVLRAFGMRRAALFGALAASISPWAFQLGRFSSSVSFEPALLLLWMYFCLRSRRLLDAALGGLFLSLTLYSYPTALVQVPLLVLPLAWLRRHYKGLERRFVLTYVVTACVASVPLAQYFDPSAGQTRVNQIAVINGTMLEHPEAQVLMQALGTIAQDFALHFSPGFLFFTGDHVLRHSTQVAGEWSWLDMFALLGGVWLLLEYLLGRLTSARALGPTPPARDLLLFCVWGYATGVVPAALTTEGIPHALRSAGALPFLAMSAGVLVWLLGRRWQLTYPLAAVLSAVFAFHLLSYYALTYPAASASDWDADVRQSAAQAQHSGDWAQFASKSSRFPTVAARYFLVEYGGESCISSATRLQALRRQSA